jgi:hypothetical protein
MGLPLEPLTAHDIGQAAGEKEHRQDQKKKIEHVKFLPVNMVFDAMVRSELYCSARHVKRSSKEAAAVSRLRKKWLFLLSICVHAELTHLGWAGLPLLWIESDDCQRFYVCKG